jgi:hypothetical protein
MTDSSRPLTYQVALEEALRPVTPNMKPGPEYADDKRLFQGIPGIECAPGGRLWSTWYSGGQGESPLNYIVLVTSGDDGGTWSPPKLVIDPPGHVRACDSNVWLDPTGRLWLFWTQMHTLHDGRWGVWAIATEQPDEASPRWSSPRRLCDGIMLNKPTVLANGDWLFPVSLLTRKVMNNETRMLPTFLRRHLHKLMTEEQLQAMDHRHGAGVYASTDQGRSFHLRGRAVPPYDQATHNEHMIVQRGDGTLWMLLRSSAGSPGINQSTSADLGVTWSPVTYAGLPHTSSRFFLRRLRSGRLLLVKHEASTDDEGQVHCARDRLTAYLSDDDGRTWANRLCLEPGRCSYPDGTQGEDGRIYVIYDQGRRAEKKILMAVFTEDDIRSGGFQSRFARQRVLINQATGEISDADNWNQSKGKGEGDLVFTGI